MVGWVAPPGHDDGERGVNGVQSKCAVSTCIAMVTSCARAVESSKMQEVSVGATNVASAKKDM